MWRPRGPIHGQVGTTRVDRIIMFNRAGLMGSR